MLPAPQGHTTRAVRVAAMAVCVFVSVASAAAVVPCNDGFVEYTCPDDYPVCCVWPENGVVAACCPSGAVCDLGAGLCVVHHVARNATAAPTTTGPAPTSQSGITVPVSEAAAFITFGAIGFIVGIVGCIFLAFKVFICARARQLRLRHEAEERRLLAGQESSSDDADEQVNGADDDDESGLCTLCFAKRMDCALFPCAHVCACRTCASKLTTCPICRTEIRTFTVFKNKIYIKAEKRAATARVNTTTGPVVTDERSMRGEEGVAPILSTRSQELEPTPRVPTTTTPPTTARRVVAIAPVDQSSSVRDGAAEPSEAQPAAIHSGIIIINSEEEPVAAMPDPEVPPHDDATGAFLHDQDEDTR